MKHLILGGGHLTRAEDGGRAWVEALLARSGAKARVAFCLFARDENEWGRVLEELQAVIRCYAGGTQVSFETMSPQNFIKVSKWANVIFMVGGDYPARLKAALERYEDVLSLWNGKTICGSSAGADVMCQRYMRLGQKKIEDGLGWVAANFIPHWRAPDWPGWSKKDWDAAAKRLAGRRGETPLLCLREGDFIEVEIK
jgi:hypothetical protein